MVKVLDQNIGAMRSWFWGVCRFLSAGGQSTTELTLDLCRWSVMAYETKLPRQASSSTVTEDFGEDSEVPLTICLLLLFYSAGHGTQHREMRPSLPPAV